MNSERAEAQARAGRAAPVEALADLESADGRADTGTEAELPSLERRGGFGSRLAESLGLPRPGHHRDHRDAYREGPQSRAPHAGLLNVGEHSGRGQPRQCGSTPALQGWISRAAARLPAERAGGWHSGGVEGQSRDW